MFDEIPDLFSNNEDDKINKNGTAKFQNLGQILNDEAEGEGEEELLHKDHGSENSHHSHESNDSHHSYGNPLDRSDSFENLMKMGSREKGVSIQDIPKIPIEKVQVQNNENSGLLLNNNMSGISSSYDPTFNVNNLLENKANQSDSDILSANKSVDLNSNRIEIQNRNQRDTYRESDYSYTYNKSHRQYDNDDELFMESLLKNASQIQHVMKDYMDSERNDLHTERGEDRNEVKDEISTLRDKIYR